MAKKSRKIYFVGFSISISESDRTGKSDRELINGETEDVNHVL